MAASKTDLAVHLLATRRAGPCRTPLYNEALALIVHQESGGRSERTAKLGRYPARSRPYDKAVALLQQAVELSRKGQFRLTTGVGALDGPASIHSQLGRYNEALQLLEEGKPLAAIAKNERRM